MSAVTGTPILMYHSVGTQAAPAFREYTLDPALLAEHLDLLASEGYVTLTVGELAALRAAGSVPPRSVALTFDDAYADFEDVVLPALQERGLRATLFVPTAYVGGTARWLRGCGEGDRPILSWAALADLPQDVVEIGAHSHTHPELDRLPREQAAHEVRTSQRLLEDALGRRVGGFAYPYGYWDRASRDLLARAGFDYACAVGELTSTRADHRLALPRHSVRGGTGADALERVLSHPRSATATAASHAKRVIWHGVRQVRRTPASAEGTVQVGR